MWFEALTGFRERDGNDVAAQFVLDDTFLTSVANGRTMQCGRFETPSLSELRERYRSVTRSAGVLRVREVVANVQDLHRVPANAGALFQVASQFNTLEMVSPSVTPDDGIDSYERDRTQGPACAIACGAGTIYRNYLVPIAGARGQSSDRQIDCLADLAAQLRVEVDMINGYAFLTHPQLAQIGVELSTIAEVARDELMGDLRVGMQWDTEVTLSDAGHCVSQAYCSALPIAYSKIPSVEWEPFAQLVLDAAYEATFAAAVVNADRTGNHTVYLTLLGGGAFGNDTAWIVRAIQRAVERFQCVDLDVAIVSYGSSNRSLRSLLT
jgi:hypothetical protein